MLESVWKQDLNAASGSITRTQHPLDLLGFPLPLVQTERKAIVSDRPQGENWWLASDGRWYPPELTPGQNLPPPSKSEHLAEVLPAPVQFVPLALTWITVAALVAASLASFMAMVTVGRQLLTWREWIDNGEMLEGPYFQRLGEAFAAGDTWGSLPMLGLLTAAILLIIWTFNLYRVAESRGPAGNSWSRWWAIGGWFIACKLCHPEAGSKGG